MRAVEAGQGVEISKVGSNVVMMRLLSYHCDTQTSRSVDLCADRKMDRS